MNYQAPIKKKKKAKRCRPRCADTEEKKKSMIYCQDKKFQNCIGAHFYKM